MGERRRETGPALRRGFFLELQRLCAQQVLGPEQS